MPPPPQELPEELVAALLAADNPPCRPDDGPATDCSAERNSSSPRSPQILPRPYPSPSSTCDSLDDNRFSTSVVCHEPLHPITLQSHAGSLAYRTIFAYAT